MMKEKGKLAAQVVLPHHAHASSLFTITKSIYNDDPFLPLPTTHQRYKNCVSPPSAAGA